MSFSLVALWSSAGNLSLTLKKVKIFNLWFTKGHQMIRLSHEVTWPKQYKILHGFFLALSVLGERGCVQGSIQVVIHGRDINPKNRFNNRSVQSSPVQFRSKKFIEYIFNFHLLVLFTSFWCSVSTLSFVSGGMNTKSTEASSSSTSRRGNFGDPKSSFTYRGQKASQNEKVHRKFWQ